MTEITRETVREAVHKAFRATLQAPFTSFAAEAQIFSDNLAALGLAVVPVEQGPLSDIQKERQRQVDAEGWSSYHDDQHTKGEMALAAAAYAYATNFTDQERAAGYRPGFWPASRSILWFKPTTRRRDLIKAGALIVAEIERRDRAPRSCRRLSSLEGGPGR